MTKHKHDRRTIGFVTGTRAEFGLMRSTLLAIRQHPQLELQIIATGMHLSEAHGKSVDQIRKDGWKVNATVPWESARNEFENAEQTGHAMAGIAVALKRLKTDIVLVVGDRVEAFAAAAAGHVAGVVVAHVHGGDRALGQVDDSLRHAITKLSRLHFPATAQSEQRILKLGEDRRYVHRVGSPGVDGITAAAGAIDPTLRPGQFVLLVLHPTDTDEASEFQRASMVFEAVRDIGFAQIVIVYPNNDPGSAGIMRCWDYHLPASRGHKPRNQSALKINRSDAIGTAQTVIVYRDVPRPMFLALVRDAAVLVGNSSSGIIEAASFGTPVLDIGPRQCGRERGANVINVPFSQARIQQELHRIWNHGNPIRYPRKNVYGGNGAGRRIASLLAKIKVEPKLLRKLITY